MTNIERAADIVRDNSFSRRSEDVAQALADAGLLMPDLPEPDEFCDWDMDPLVVRIDTATREVFLECLDPYEGKKIYMFSDEAREVAYALLAAASYTERNQE